MFTERQMQIIETAVKLIADEGIQNLTIKNLAKEIGISEPALYRHFANKLQILKNILNYFHFKMEPAINELIKDKIIIDNIINFIKIQLKIFATNPHFAKVIFAEANFQNDETLKNTILKMMNKTQSLLNNKISIAQQSGEITERITSTNLTRFIIGSIRFMVTQWSMSDMVFDIENEGSLLCEDIRKILVSEK